jgi:hypothetical protein
MKLFNTLIGSRFRWWGRVLAAGVAATVLGGGAVAASATAAAGASVPDASANYTFQTLNNPRDNTFNQLLGINQHGLIAGYFGSGKAGHPNKGYLLPNDGMGGNYVNENFPGSAQTQVTGLNDNGDTVGFWANQAGANFGFYRTPNGRFHTADYPTGNPASPVMDQLLGVNDAGVAVGSYTDKQGNVHGYSYSLASHRYHQIDVAGASSTSTTAINNSGDIAGFETNGGNTEGFLRLNDGRVITLNVPGASMTQAFGVNDGDEVVGAYTVGTSSSPPTHGFIWSPGFGFQNVDDPNGIGATTVNGVNDHGRLVGFYTDSSGNTDGFLATP